MGVVYKAVDLTLERTVALKFLPHEVAVSPADKENMVREARAASALDHPNIGVIHGLEESEDHQLFIVMGYYEGETLTQKINRGVVSVRESLNYAIQIAKGLSAAHSRNIVHRDIKPSNIIITTDNTAKIVDFGLARAVTSASATQSVSNTGTLPYMAPEQILGEAIDQRVDVWALGVIMVQMLTGSHPFLRPNAPAMTFAILNQPPTAVDAVPAPVQPIVYRALSKQASHRYANTEDMVKDLEAARAEITSTPSPLEDPTVTRAVSARELRSYVDNASTPRWGASPRKFRRIALAAAAVLLIAAGILFTPAVREHMAGLAYAYTGGEKHIAVLPFASPEGDPDFAAVSQGLSDSVTGDLSNLEAAQQSLWVLPASLVHQDQVTDPTAAFHKLGATIAIEGRLERRGTGVFLTLNLIDAKHLRQIGSARLSDRSGNLSALESQAVQFIAQSMRVRVSPDALRATANVPPSSYEAYLKALEYLKRFDKPGNVDLAISSVLSAVQTDPGFALGYATLGAAYRLKYETDHQARWLDEAASNCHKALQIDPHLPSARVTLGQLNTAAGKNELALEEFRKALELDSHNAEALTGMAGAYESLGRLADAESAYQRAIALRPDYWGGYTSLGTFYDNQHRSQDAIAQFRRVTQIIPDSAVAYSNLGAVYMGVDDGAAIATFQKSLQIEPTYAAYSNLGFLYSNQSHYAEAATNLRKALDLNDKDWRVWANLLDTYNHLGDSENVRITQARTQELLEQYVGGAPGDIVARSALGTFYIDGGQHQKALAIAKSSIAAAPKDSFVLANVAEIYEGLGDRKHALLYTQESLANGSSLDELKQRQGLQNVLADPGFRSSKK
jgi:tetratricopeptide (TPR) repeat protein/TolB-like protein